MPRKIGLGRGLGRGLEALLDNNDYNQTETEQTPSETPQETVVTVKKTQDAVQQLPIDKLVPNPYQPRKNYDETTLNEMAETIKIYGILQPILAKYADDGTGTYIILSGHCRTRAAKIAGLDTVPAIVGEYSDQNSIEISLVENIQRTDLNAIEEASAYKNLMDFSKLSQDKLAERVGKPRSTVANALRLLKLSIEIQKGIEEGKISAGHARALLAVNDSNARDKLYRVIIKNDLNVRKTEKLASSLNSGKTGKDKPDKKNAENENHPPEIDAMIEKFIHKMGTKVKIEGDLNGGKIYIEYYSMEDLERLYEILG